MKTNTTARAIVQIRGPEVTYGLLRLAPDVRSRAGGIDLESFTVRSGNDRFALSDLPIMRSLPKAAREDVLYSTFEADDEDRAERHEIDFVISEYDETATISFRAVEHDHESIRFEVEDQAGDWLPVEDVRLVELLPDAFMRILEMSAMSLLHDHNMDWLPMAAES